MSHNYGAQVPTFRPRINQPQTPEAEVPSNLSKPKINALNNEDVSQNTNKQVVSANNNSEGSELNTQNNGIADQKRRQLKINKQNSNPSEEIVYNRLRNQLGEDERILKKPRIYIGDGSSGEFAVPDFMIYNTKTGGIVRIVDAKNGGGQLSSPQQKLNEEGGRFNGSSRAKEAKAQSIPKGSVEIERTNVANSKE